MDWNIENYIYHVGLGEFSDNISSEFEYNHFMLNFDIWCKGKNQYFLDKYIGRIGNYYLYINDRYQSLDKTIQDLNSFMIKCYRDFNSSCNLVICNEDVYVKTPLAERKKIIIRQQKNATQRNLSRADTYGTEVFVCFREVSALEWFELNNSQI